MSLSWRSEKFSEEEVAIVAELGGVVVKGSRCVGQGGGPASDFIRGLLLRYSHYFEKQRQNER